MYFPSFPCESAAMENGWNRGESSRLRQKAKSFHSLPYLLVRYPDLIEIDQRRSIDSFVGVCTGPRPEGSPAPPCLFEILVQHAHVRDVGIELVDLAIANLCDGGQVFVKNLSLKRTGVVKHDCKAFEAIQDV